VQALAVFAGAALVPDPIQHCAEAVAAKKRHRIVTRIDSRKKTSFLSTGR
jgi:hypothetical protein